MAQSLTISELPALFDSFKYLFVFDDYLTVLKKGLLNVQTYFKIWIIGKISIHASLPQVLANFIGEILVGLIAVIEGR